MFTDDPVVRAIRRFATPGTVALDIGANHGLTAEVMSSLGLTVFAFEPITACADAIEAKHCSNLEVIRVAVSDEEGSATFYVDPRPEMGMVASSLMVLPGIDGDQVTVPVTTVDKFVAERDIAPTFIKIDVEGFEEKVIAGAMRTIRAHRPVIVFEVWGYNWPRFEKVVADLSDIYRFECASDGADALKRYSAVITESDDVIAIPL